MTLCGHARMSTTGRVLSLQETARLGPRRRRHPPRGPGRPGHPAAVPALGRHAGHPDRRAVPLLKDLQAAHPWHRAEGRRAAGGQLPPPARPFPACPASLPRSRPTRAASGRWKDPRCLQGPQGEDQSEEGAKAARGKAQPTAIARRPGDRLPEPTRATSRDKPLADAGGAEAAVFLGHRHARKPISWKMAGPVCPSRQAAITRGASLPWAEARCPEPAREGRRPAPEGMRRLRAGPAHGRAGSARRRGPGSGSASSNGNAPRIG